MTSIFDVDLDQDEMDSMSYATPTRSKMWDVPEPEPYRGIAGKIPRIALGGAGGIYNFLTLPKRLGEGTASTLVDMLGMEQPPETGIGRITGDDFVAAYDYATGGDFEPKSGSERILDTALTRGIEYAGMTGLANVPGALGAAIYGTASGGGSQALREAGFGNLTSELATTAALNPKSTIKLAKEVGKIPGKIGRGFKRAYDIMTFSPEHDLAATPLSLREVSEAAVNDIALSQNSMNARLTRFKEANVKPIARNMENLAQQIDLDDIELDAASIEREILDKEKENYLNDIYPVAKDSPTGKSDTVTDIRQISEMVNERYDAKSKDLSKQYKDLKKYARQIQFKPTKAATEARKLLKKLQSGTFQFGKREQAINEAMKILEGVIEWVPPQKLPNGKTKRGHWVTRTMTAEQARQNAQIINEMQNYEDLDPKIKNLSRVVAHAFKSSARDAMGKELATAFDILDADFARTQKVYNSDIMQQLRDAEKFESIPEYSASNLLIPSNMQKLRAAVGNNAPEYRLAERLYAERLSEVGPQEAEKMLRDIKKYANKDSYERMEAIAKSPTTKEGRDARRRAAILREITDLIETGARPNQILKLMRTPKGNALVNDVLRRTEQGRKIKTGLERIALGDIGKTIFDKDGSLNLDALKQVLKDPFNRSILKKTMGHEGFKQLVNLKTFQDNYSKNLAALQARHPNLLDQFFDLAETKPYLWMPLMVGVSGFKPLYLLIASGILSKTGSGHRMLKSIEEAEKAYTGASVLGGLAKKKGQKALNVLASPTPPEPSKFLEAIMQLGLAMSEVDEDKE